MLTLAFYFRFFACDYHMNTFLQILIGLARIEFPEFEVTHWRHSAVHTILPVVDASLYNALGS